MILGFIDIDPTARVIHTHRDSYLLDNLTVVSARRPLLAFGVLAAAGFGGFGLVFGDLLYTTEIIASVILGGAGLATGVTVGQLRLLSRDLRGSELGGVIWGSYAALNGKRLAIVRAIRGLDPVPAATGTTAAGRAS